MSSVPRAIKPSVNGWQGDYLDAQYQRFKEDPGSVPEDLRSFFQGFDLASAMGGPPAGPQVGEGHGGESFQAGVSDLITAYREWGHFAAQLDPFGRPRPRPAALELAYHGLTPADLDRVVEAGTARGSVIETLGKTIARLEATYCRCIGAEFMHIQNAEERDWIIERAERNEGMVAVNRETKFHILEQLLRAECFETFCQKKYPGEKRFSLEGGESLIPFLNHVCEQSVEFGVQEIVLAMAHRGRLNVLNNVLGKTWEQIFTEFEDNWEEDFVDGGGDVKYHRGYSGRREFPGGKILRLALASNPSHLESVNAVVAGRCRAKQRLRADVTRTRVVPVVVHGDAAVIGQGIVAEMLNLSQLEGYTTGGTIHVVANNLIGFTTSPEDARSSPYCTDIAKMIDAPILHVNGEDPEAVVACAQIAVEFRQKFRKDVFVDLWCFRRYGHNEQDEPSFTQPILSDLIAKKSTVLRVYAERLLAEGVISEADMASVRAKLDETIETAQRTASEHPYDPTIEPGSEKWAGMTGEYSHDPVETGASPELLAEVCEAMGRVPEGFHVNPKLVRLLKARQDLPTTGQISYADAESLAFGTLLCEGIPVRVSGQDSRRGTFSHRHAVLRDRQSGEAYLPLNHIRELGVVGSETPPGSLGADGRPRQARLCVHDSPLSEVSVLGYEYGYSLADPNMLVCWEAQFGDFANGAQVIIDQYLASAELKWERWSGLVVLLPHGYEGAGPEHSSARLERFLQLGADDNMQVVNPTTGAQIFHLLRRQVKRKFRKPLIVLTPKSMLRVPTSRFEDLTSGSFQEIIDDPSMVTPAARSKVTRVILCSGKLYFELAERRDVLSRKDVAIVRVEQLFPLHRERLDALLARYPKGVERIWAQEEPRNMGAYFFMRDELGEPLTYIGRDPSASPAVGSKSRHKQQQEDILTRAIGPKPGEKNSRESKPMHAKA